MPYGQNGAHAGALLESHLIVDNMETKLYPKFG
jgi:hypothetical protein